MLLNPFWLTSHFGPAHFFLEVSCQGGLHKSRALDHSRFLRVLVFLIGLKLRKKKNVRESYQRCWGLL